MIAVSSSFFNSLQIFWSTVTDTYYNNIIILFSFYYQTLLCDINMCKISSSLISIAIEFSKENSTYTIVINIERIVWYKM